jgi:hypothetical protein
MDGKHKSYSLPWSPALTAATAPERYACCQLFGVQLTISTPARVTWTKPKTQRMRVDRRTIFSAMKVVSDKGKDEEHAREKKRENSKNKKLKAKIKITFLTY